MGDGAEQLLQPGRHGRQQVMLQLHTVTQPRGALDGSCKQQRALLALLQLRHCQEYDTLGSNKRKGCSPHNTKRMSGTDISLSEQTQTNC
jgi:hypothetical protein